MYLAYIEGEKRPEKVVFLFYMHLGQQREVGELNMLLETTVVVVTAVIWPGD